MRIERAIECGMVPPCGMGTEMRTVRRADGPMTAWRHGDDCAWITYGRDGSRVRMVATGLDCIRTVRDAIETEAIRCGQPLTVGWATVEI